MTHAIPAEDRPSVALRAARAVVPRRMRPGLAGAVRSLQHRGDAVHCACCEGGFDRFIAHRGRPYAKCPRCGSLERHRLLVGFLRTHTNLWVAQRVVLHVAPEYAVQRQLRQLSNLRYRSADLDSPLAMDTVDLLDLPYPDAAFDFVICNHVLEHVADDGRALREIRRVLAPNGCAILMSPIDERLAQTLEDSTITSAERHRVYGQSDHLRRYGRDFGARVAAAGGFEVQRVRYIDQLDKAEIVREGLRRESEVFSADDIFVCRPLASEREARGTPIPSPGPR
jgi:SAM-dependent methyltransferase